MSPADASIPPEPSSPAGLAAWGAAIVGQVLSIEDRIGMDFYRVGQRLAVLARPEVYRSLGHKSFGDLLAKREMMSRFWATQLVQIVGRIPPARARELGPSKCWAIIRYAAATGQQPSEVAESDLAEQSVRRLQEAAARERARRKGLLDTPEHREAERAARKIARKLRALGLRDAHVRVLLRQTSWWIRIELPAAVALMAFFGPAARGPSRNNAAPALPRRAAGRGPPGRRVG